jgi:hypothetical protein
MPFIRQSKIEIDNPPRSRQDSNLRLRLCRPAPRHSATRSLHKRNQLKCLPRTTGVRPFLLILPDQRERARRPLYKSTNPPNEFPTCQRLLRVLAPSRLTTLLRAPSRPFVTLVTFVVSIDFVTQEATNQHVVQGSNLPTPALETSVPPLGLTTYRTHNAQGRNRTSVCPMGRLGYSQVHGLSATCAKSQPGRI